MIEHPDFTAVFSNGRSWGFFNLDKASFLDKFFKIIDLSPGSDHCDGKVVLANSARLAGISISSDAQFIHYKDVPLLAFYSFEQLNFFFFYDQTEGLKINRVVQLSLAPLIAVTHRDLGICLHAALIETPSGGVLLVGASGAGKTTCCSRLLSGWRAWSDDMTMVLPSSEFEYFAHPLPTFSRLDLNISHPCWNLQKSISVKAIFFIDQGDSDSIQMVGKGQAAALLFQHEPKIYSRIFRNFPARHRLKNNISRFESAYKLSEHIPCYKLKISLKGHFWNLINEVL